MCKCNGLWFMLHFSIQITILAVVASSIKRLKARLYIFGATGVAKKVLCSALCGLPILMNAVAVVLGKTPEVQKSLCLS